MKRMLCLWLPNWPIQRLVVARPELETGALVIHAHTTQHGERVVACSLRARACGIRVGMPLVEAASFEHKSPRASRSPNFPSTPAARGASEWKPLSWHRIVYDPAADRGELLRLAEWCEQFSPLVGVEGSHDGRCEPACDASLLLDVTGLGRWFGGEECLTRQIVAAFQRRGYFIQATLADTIGVAWAVAHFGGAVPEEASSFENSALSVPAVETVAACAVSEFRIVSSGEHLSALRPLPIEALRLGEPALELLHQLGVQRIHTLLSLPRTSLTSRFGKEVLQRLDQAVGVVEEVLVVHRPPPEFSARWSLEHPTALGYVLETGVRQVLEQVARELAAQDRAALQFDVRFDCVLPSGCSAIRFSVDLFRPVVNVEHLWHLVRLQLERKKLPGPVREICVRVPWVVARERHQQELFASDDHARQRELAKLVDRLRSRLGCASVLQPLLQPEVQPECAYHFVPAASHEVFPAVQRREVVLSVREPPATSDRPLHVYDVPRPVRVFAVASDGPPVRFYDQRRWHDVHRSWGPERIETGWWRGRTIRRDYYRLETTTGQRFWLFRHLADGQWFLQGVFA